jgi:simple sugar transport system substrate-binding protein
MPQAMVRKPIGLVVAGLMVLALGYVPAAAAPEAVAPAAGLMGPLSQVPPAQPSGKKYKFVFVVHDGTTTFYRPVINGMNIACSQVGADCQFMGPPNGSDIPAEVDLIENAIQSGADAVFLDIPDQQAMEKVTAEAKAKNVEVFFIGTVYPDKPEYGSIGQDLYRAGQVMGQQAAKSLPDGGKVGIVICCPGILPLQRRAQGAIDALNATGKFQVVGPIEISTDQTKAYGAIEALYQGNPDIKGIFGVDANTEVIGRFIQKNGLKGVVKGGGFDLVPGTLEAIKTGDMQFTTGQNPFLWGYLPVQEMWLFKEFGVRPVSLDSGADVVDASNAAGIDPLFH